ncbi:hypothetical protein CXF92_17675 [Pseudomonas sp. Choline-3u-10]|jgi:hypothetical protein|uniref:hypothetical protein n=1 Tax=Pseudomonadaceae TaxID=135621 RepID=UPI000698BEC3|nr:MULTISPECIES: hypothetical protein [Pseudomonadaceae]MAL36871.1 hypothetical protein [Pseudomonas sp.]MBU0947891.1 hypothetical protein [Gammaproteobacteria bacterium]MBK3794652.1 hypothetical protein [Stutzerimonas stutzeri]MBK3878995.1 hypothetical protein [Stutzerimonas stutzeri]PKG91603.1 hypothetical protein CXF92_17675 [Pseudomonas sp. Choline-3u-10]|tara:strand:+ start:371 stop:706 length:336 start_codon:yes stop_codon:yes gene_type:complete
MTVMRSERRENHTLRRHIDYLLSAGAGLTGRSPITIDFHECTLTVRNGRLFNETGIRSLVTVIARHVWPCPESRHVAVEICLGQLVDTRQDDFGTSGEPKRSPMMHSISKR